MYEIQITQIEKGCIKGILDLLFHDSDVIERISHNMISESIDEPIEITIIDYAKCRLGLAKIPFPRLRVLEYSEYFDIDVSFEEGGIDSTLIKDICSYLPIVKDRCSGSVVCFGLEPADDPNGQIFIA